MTFVLDTSGSVNVCVERAATSETWRLFLWHDLEPFEQGYFEAMLRGLYGEPPNRFMPRPPRFDDLAGETLAAGIKDCVSFQNYVNGLGMKTGKVEGSRFWRGRQAGLLTGAWAAAFPPLTVRYDKPSGQIVLEYPQ